MEEIVPGFPPFVIMIDWEWLTIFVRTVNVTFETMRKLQGSPTATLSAAFFSAESLLVISRTLRWRTFRS